jgi:hypothetical protein
MKINKNNYRKLTIFYFILFCFLFFVFFLTQKFQERNKYHRKHRNQRKSSPVTTPKFGVLSQATKNKTFTSKNICSSASKGRSHIEYLA